MNTNKNFKNLSLSLALIGFFSANAQNSEVRKMPGINLDFMDKKTKPVDDFYKFVNGSWLEKTEIP